MIRWKRHDREVKSMKVKINEKERWCSNSVRTICINNEWYTRGDNSAYSLMLEFVDTAPPTTENIYSVAEDIRIHSNTEADVTSIMFILRRDAVMTFYEVEEEWDEAE